MKLPQQDKWNELFRNMQKKEDLKLFFPRHYATPHGYLNPSYIQTHYFFKYQRFVAEPDSMELIKKFLPAQEDLIGNAALLRHFVIDDLTKEEFPIFFVKEDFLRAVQNTNPPDFNLQDLKIPRNPLIFCFPFDSLKVEDKYVPFITFAKVDKTFFVSFHFCDSNVFYMQVDYVWNLKTYNDIAKETHENVSMTYKHTSQQAEDFAVRNKILIRNLGLLVFNILLILNSRPKLIQTEDFPKKLQDSTKEKIKRFAEPLWIGLGYKIIKEHVGTHSSPHIHWRRGHIRNQACGEGHKFHKIIWIEPTIVGA